MSKAAMFRWHQYAGLIIALFLLIQGVTGAVLSWRTELARLIDPHAMVRQSPLKAGPRAGTVPFSWIVDGAQMSDMLVRRVYAPDRPDGVYLVELADGEGGARYATVDPGDGRVLRRGGLTTFPIEAAMQLHYRMMLGPMGTALIFLNGCALLWMLFTGLGYFWPKKGRWAKSLAVKWSQPNRLVLRQLHRNVAVLVAVPLLVISVTGLLLAGPEVLEAGAKPPVVTPAPLGRLDAALARAQAAFPGQLIRDVRLSDTRIRVNFFAPAHGARSVHQVTVDLSEMTVSNVVAAENNPALWMKILPIHSGEIAGQTGRILFTLVAIMLAALAMTGPLMWWQRKRAGRPKS